MVMKRFIATVGLLMSVVQGLRAESADIVVDVVVYGSTPAAITASIAAKRLGCSVVMVSPEDRIGGLTTGGLGRTDVGNPDAFGGLALEFYRDIAKHYDDDSSWKWQDRDSYKIGKRYRGKDTMWKFEPSVALSVLEGWLRTYGIDVRRGEKLDRGADGVRKEGVTVLAFRTLSGRRYFGKTFIDATYEGDLMAAAGISYALGRESNATYGERFNGVQPVARYHNLANGIDPYVRKGDRDSGLLPGIDDAPLGTPGEGDRRIQAYCYRMCLTDVPENRIPFAKPAGYDERDFELLFRNFELGGGPNAHRPNLIIPWINTGLPNRKTDTNNCLGFSTDYCGANWDYPEASYEEREAIARRHLVRQQGLMWTLANHPRVPESVRKEVSRWGTCRDEFQDGYGDGWQRQLYIREARRMKGETVITEHHCFGRRKAARAVALASYQMDSHHVRRYVGEDGFVHNEGDVEEKVVRPFPIDYGALTPRRNECVNMIVPVCVSASHIAYGSIRMEPVFFALGQAAGTAAALSVQEHADVQDLDYGKLRARLLADGQKVEMDTWPDGTSVDAWFGTVPPVDVTALGTEYRFDLNCIFPDGELHTREIQDLIDKAANGGGVITVTPGVYRTGALFFRPNVHLRLMEGAVLFGSDNLLDYPIVDTRIEGKNQKYIAALINAEGCDGFTIVGPGMIDGNGYRSWRGCVMRRKWCPTAVNLDDQRARLLYVARSRNVRIENVRFQNPQFWTQHFWQCENVRLTGVVVYSPSAPKGHVKSCTDALDLDETRNVVVRDCRFANNDDAIALKCGDGPAVENVLIENTTFGFCHGALVLGSEAKRVRNVLMRHCTVDQSMRVLWIKFRNDMAQHYDHLAIEDVTGTAEWFFFARQFSDNRDLKGLPEGTTREMMRSTADHFALRDCRINCREFFHMSVEPEDGKLSDFTFENLAVCGENVSYDPSVIERCEFKDVTVDRKEWTGRRHELKPIIRPPVPSRGAVVLSDRNAKGGCGSVILPCPSTLQQREAARHLTNYLFRITGSPLASVVRLQPGTPDLGEDGFRLQTLGGELRLSGGERGILYAVWEVLERFGGCGWFSPLTEVVPVKDRVEIPDGLDETHRPAFLLRTTWADQFRRHVDYACRMRVNGNTDPVLPDRLGGEAFPFVTGLGHQHTFATLLPSDVWFARHPEYFCEHKGRRRSGTEVQPCLTHPDVLRIVVSNVLERLAGEPSAKIVGLSQNDNRQYCECAKCREIDEQEDSHCGTLLRFVNAVAAEIEKVRPEVLVQTLIYDYTRKPPKHVRPLHNVIVGLCPYECRRNVPIADASESQNADFMRDFDVWAKMSDQLYIFDYAANFRNQMYPYRVEGVTHENLKMFRDRKVKYYYMDLFSSYADFGELRAYLLAKWMWDPDLDEKVLTDRFFAGYYGKAAPLVRECYERTRAAQAEHRAEPLWIFDSKPPEWYTPEMTSWIRRKLAEAKTAVADDPMRLRNVRFTELNPLVVELDRAAKAARQFFITREPSRFPDEEARIGDYRTVLSLLEEAERNGERVHLCSGPIWEPDKLAAWKRTFGEKRDRSVKDVLTLRGDDFFISSARHVKSDGSVLRFLPSTDKPMIRLDFRNIAYDADAEYELRLRVKVEKGDRIGAAFRATLGPKGAKAGAILDIDGTTREGAVSEAIEKRTDEVDGGWDWYAFKPRRFHDDDRFSFASGAWESGGGAGTTKSVLLDVVELRRCN